MSSATIAPHPRQKPSCQLQPQRSGHISLSAICFLVSSSHRGYWSRQLRTTAPQTTPKRMTRCLLLLINLHAIPLVKWLLVFCWGRPFIHVSLSMPWKSSLVLKATSLHSSTRTCKTDQPSSLFFRCNLVGEHEKWTFLIHRGRRKAPQGPWKLPRREG